MFANCHGSSRTRVPQTKGITATSETQQSRTGFDSLDQFLDQPPNPKKIINMDCERERPSEEVGEKD